MTEGEAQTALASMCDAYNSPELTPEELDGCLLRSRRPDYWGYYPIDPAYTGTYDLNHAAFLAWHLKAGKCANFHDVTMQGRNFASGQVYEHCLKMIGEYRRYINASVAVYPPC
jgi:hypothetical protein